MYAHQVIESQIKMLENAKSSIEFFKNNGDLDVEDKTKLAKQAYYAANMELFYPHIIKAKKFHSDSYNSLDKSFPSLKPGMKGFCQNSKYLRLPYKCCWFDYINDNDGDEPLPSYQSRVRKRGLLVMEVKKDLFFIIIYNDAKDVSRKTSIPLTWLINPIGYYVSVGKDFPERNDLEELYEMMEPMFNSVYKNTSFDFKKLGNIFLYPLMYDISRNDVKTMLEEDSNDLKFLEMYLLLLNCKNITTKEVPAPAKLNKKRRKQNKQELFSYYTLKIKQNITRGSNKKGRNTMENRVHYCRGHFKEYTKNNPLFGKHTGLYWWQPHLRGNQEKGAIYKNYKADIPKPKKN